MRFAHVGLALIPLSSICADFGLSECNARLCRVFVGRGTLVPG